MMLLTSFLAALTVTTASIATPDDQIFFDQYEDYYFRINETISNGLDAVEFYNPTFGSVDLTGWYFTDSDATHRFYFPAGTRISGRSHLAVGDLPFGLGAPDAVILRSPEEIAFDSFSWSEHPLPNSSYQRCPEGFGSFMSITPSSLGTANNCP